MVWNQEMSAIEYPAQPKAAVPRPAAGKPALANVTDPVRITVTSQSLLATVHGMRIALDGISLDQVGFAERHSAAEVCQRWEAHLSIMTSLFDDLEHKAGQLASALSLNYLRPT